MITLLIALILAPVTLVTLLTVLGKLALTLPGARDWE